MTTTPKPWYPPNIFRVFVEALCLQALFVDIVKFTTWEKYQFLWIERRIGRKLFDYQKILIIEQNGWRDYKKTT